MVQPKSKITTAEYLELDTIMESDDESVIIMIDTTKKDGVGEVVRGAKSSNESKKTRR